MCHDDDLSRVTDSDLRIGELKYKVSDYTSHLIVRI